MKHTWILALVGLGMFRLCLYANPLLPCDSGVAVSVIDQSTCTIGDKTFDFKGSTVQGTETSDNVEFITDADNPNGPGFILEALPGSSLSVTDGGFLFLDLGFIVSITDPSSTSEIVGISTTAIGADVTPSHDQPPHGFDAYAESTAQIKFLNCTRITAVAGANDNFASTFGSVLIPDGCQQDNYNVGATFAVAAFGTDTASLTSAEFNVTEADVVPEPTLFPLMAVALVSIYCRRVRTRRQA
jgi:hypothetical protein